MRSCPLSLPCLSYLIPLHCCREGSVVAATIGSIAPIHVVVVLDDDATGANWRINLHLHGDKHLDTHAVVVLCLHVLLHHTSVF